MLARMGGKKIKRVPSSERHTSMLARVVRKTKIKNRLIVSFLLLSFIPLYTTAIYAYNKSSQDIQAKMSKYSMELVEQIKTNIRQENQKFESVSEQIMMDVTVQKNLIDYESLDGYTKMTTTLTINEMLSDKYSLLNHIRNIRINTMSGETFYDQGFDGFREEDIERLTEMVTEAGGDDVWTSGMTRSGTDCIILARQIHSRFDWSRPLGYIFVAIDESFYSSHIYGSVDMGTGSDLFIVNLNGEVLSTRNAEVTIGESHTYQPLIKKLENNHPDNKNAFSIQLDDRDYLAAYSYDLFSKWYLVSLIPYSYLHAETWGIRRDIIIVSALCLVFSLLLTFLISSSISAPLKRLVTSMKQASAGNLNVTIRDKEKDEVGYLTNQFDQMLTQIQHLIEQIKADQRKKREIELQLLQAQINPHFLFNTLNSLKWTAALSQAESVSNGLGALAELLRNTIVDRKEMVRLQDELNNIDHYVTIQKVRYGSSFTVEYDIDEQLLDCKILKFLLQPIVENAIIHGLDGQEKENKITITSMKVDDHMEMTVSDNGIGMDSHQVQQLLRRKHESDQRLANIGIANVHERIKLHFGAQYGLQIESKIGQGTDVIIKIPLIVEEG